MPARRTPRWTPAELALSRERYPVGKAEMLLGLFDQETAQ